ncbi:FecCD family ABC transporter permease [Virgibacillus pantothenticus]|uniref:FecCD family ABC transporter permease n=1 Tax=Virgibacillus pantothenticus TaxID=1473 RepID=UPI001115A6AE|nr:iron ABC transporter permease [Virgibacillus pantothenticus]
MKKVEKEINHSAFTIKLVIAIILCFLTFLVATKMGAKETSFSDVFHAFFQQDHSESYSTIRDIRLPREVAVMFVGAALAVSGAIMQGMTRNPLADPGLLGLTSGANAALAFALALVPKVDTFGIMIACFIGAAFGAGLVFGIGSIQKGGFTPVKLVLAGAAISIFLQAVADGVGLYFKLSKNISLWTAGGAIGTTWQQLAIVVPFILVGLLIALTLSRQVTILSLNEEVAIGLGQETKRIRWLLFFVVVILAGAAVALVGNMAFIGLMVPHMVRAIVGVDYRQIIPISIFAGAVFMLLADLVGRTINAPMETPVVSIVAVLGLPFFLFVVRKGGRALQ